VGGVFAEMKNFREQTVRICLVPVAVVVYWEKLSGRVRMWVAAL
jgi:hypothetical protein